ncbi:phosphoribosylglycinamide formyltransferase [Desulfolutivibrio sulfoxidireducens]|uniref:phosphoribosylglycinamide formyltransferase n=1 Tax=Desulfolutivibrio sulfoxidireducens TaxID=2773299 RepID=UPI00159E25EA|nr:phosphoribosylglycinamide formyltransferase [Desulfolutivibrio sulfoxidireducens]QLA17915.1 phosphoribosylglycinamide formyltransferase [Desulfolutivibrio sulfoxidireducens]QLA21495.1 phosphoribosylglycinamide formyltransferase [Desulfolutivibrio sulfoxidireducens]
MKTPVAVLLSGSGSNLQAMIDKVQAGVIEADIRLVLSNRADAFGLTRAAKRGIPTAVVEHGAYPCREAFDAALLAAIAKSGARVVVLAGFMRILGPEIVSAFAGRMLNIHPALLPSFPGVHGQPDAARHGVKISGCTVHFVDEKMDHGPIVIQAAVPALADDDGKALGARILALEHRIYPQAVHWLCTGRLHVRGRHVHLDPADVPPADMAGAGPCLVNPPLEQGF